MSGIASILHPPYRKVWVVRRGEELIGVFVSDVEAAAYALITPISLRDGRMAVAVEMWMFG